MATTTTTIKNDPASSERTHGHTCDACQATWRHSDACFGDEAAHACPDCGQMQWMKDREGPQGLSSAELARALRAIMGADL